MAVRTGSLKKASGGNFRLSDSDRAFLKDLGRVRMIAAEDADNFHYADRKTGAAKRLNKLADQGLLKRIQMTVPGQGKVYAYQFADAKVAKRFGGDIPNVSRMRNAFHELIVSRIYFAENRPDSYRIEADLTEADKERVRRSGEASDRVAMPDAMFTNSAGETVVVEADSGQYNSTQIKNKISSWVGLKQVWGQPHARKSAVENYSDATVHRF